MSAQKKRPKKVKDSSYFEFTNEKLFKQIVDKKVPSGKLNQSKAK